MARIRMMFRFLPIPVPALALAMILLLLASGCVVRTEEAYRNRVQSWIGADGDALVRAWGVPDKTYRLSDGSTMISYRKEREWTSGGYTTVSYEAVYVDDKIVEVPVTEEVPVEYHSTWCETTFTLDRSNIVRHYKYEGPDCLAEEPAKR